MAKDPSYSTCIHCGKRVEWKRFRLSEQQIFDNEAARRSGQKEPHALGRYSERWTHSPERDGENRVRCEENERQMADPRDYCTVRMQNSWGLHNNTCNRPVKQEVDGEFLCGIHLGHKKKEENKRKKEDEQREIFRWAEQETEARIKKIKEFGLDAEVHYQRSWNSYTSTPTGKVVVDPDKLLELLNDAFEEF